MAVSSGDPLAFTQLLLDVIDEGRRSATYKLAVLLALIDCCATGSDAHGRPPSRISTRSLARRVVELYWPQVREYPAHPDGLRQSSQPRAITVDAVAALRRRAARRGLTTFQATARVLAGETGSCLDEVELNLVRMPLGRLQRPAGYDGRANADYPRFLYDDSAFHEGLTAGELRAASMAVELRPGVGDWLVSLAGLLRPLVELHWTRDVARFNRISLGEDELREFLFGASRTSLARLRPGLLELQHGACFYCGRRLEPAGSHVDHFVPWSRVPNDDLANLVLADGRCNANKRDNYPDIDHLQHWARRRETDLAQIAESARWPLGYGESRAAARSLYRHLPAGTRLWSAPGRFRLLDPARLSELLPTLTG